MTDKKEQGRKRKAAYDERKKSDGRKRLEILPPPKIEYHERIKARVKKYSAHLDGLSNIDDNEL